VRLIDLDPHWSVDGEGRRGMGINFECPVHRVHYLGVWFANPVDGGLSAPPSCRPTPRWQRIGDTFDTLTLTPSINADKNCQCGKLRGSGDGECSSNAPGHTPCWHGHITAGEIR